MPTILLLRHAQASFGTTDYDVLSEAGHRQVAAVHERGIAADRFVSGSLRRQRDTIAPWTTEPAVDARWDEYDAADVLSAHSASPARMERAAAEDAEVLSSRDFQVVLDDALDAWIAASAQSAAREPWPAFRGRVAAALDDLARSLARGETALVATSGGVIAACCVLLLGVPDAAFPAFNRVTVNTGLTKVVTGRRGRTLIAFNDHAHLERGGAGMLTYR